MEFVLCQRKIAISCTGERFHSFLIDPENLLQWTTFFVSLKCKKNGKCVFETKMGTSKTWIETLSANKTHIYTIWSSFQRKKESASLTVIEDKGLLNVLFTVAIPKTLPSSVIQNQLLIMDKELYTLKTILELTHE